MSFAFWLDALADFWASIPSSLVFPLAALFGVALDRLLGEPKRAHPLVGFGRLAGEIERCYNRPDALWMKGAMALRVAGALSWALAVLPFSALAWYATHRFSFGVLLDVLLLYLALGGKSLAEHAERVARDLSAGNLSAAREHVGWIVSRETNALDESGVTKACVESTLENGNDAIFGVLFWFMLLGGVGAVLFRLSNTLDAMWGYRNERFLFFGWAAARLDDALNFIPSRLTALSYALFGNTQRAFRCWYRQAPLWESPNAGPVMSSGAGSLGILLGGSAIYHGQVEERPALGEGRAPARRDIPRAISLVRSSIALWLVVYFLGGLICA